MNISEIKAKLANISETDKEGLCQFVDEFSFDERSGVIAIVNQAKKKIKLYEDEVARSTKMRVFENKYIEQGYQAICGIDEVGRGPLAGPVVACAVILPQDDMILYLNDSKQLSAKKREVLYDEIINRAVSYGIGIVSEARIDEINILQATYEAMRMAVSNLSVAPDLLLNDAVKIPGIDVKQVPIVKGDTLSASIAAASIVAKVTRDRMMQAYDEIYPGYDFASNMGYGSAKHIEALKTLGQTPIHRKSFIDNFVHKQ